MENTLFTNDNLYVLSGLNSNSVDLIYLDPPFNSKRIYSAKTLVTSFNDMWTWKDVDVSYLDKLIDQHPSLVTFIRFVERTHSKAMMSYITYMTQRIIELHRILKNTGSFYLHCDSTASHYLKLLLDEFFGKNNFRNEIIWHRNNGSVKGSQYGAKKYGVNTDTILFYTKSNSFEINPYNTDNQNSARFNKMDENGRKYHSLTSLFRSKSMGARPTLCFEWRGFRNPDLSGWRLSKDRLEEEYQKGNVVIREDGKLERRTYLDEYKGFPIDNNWTDILGLMSTSKESTGDPTQKPLSLLHRIIKASSKEGDIVLDPFCGCGTTCIASQQLNRKWIGIDIERKTSKILVERLKNYGGMRRDFVHRTVLPKRTDVKIKEPSMDIKEKLFKTQKSCCNACGTILKIKDLEIDHTIPKSKGGGDYYENYQLLCASCTKIKKDVPMEYLRIKIKSREALLKNRNSFGE